MSTPNFAFDNVEWHEPGEPPRNGCDWERNRTCPQPGETRWANLRQWHQTEIGEHIWLLWQPAVALFNGWATPDELDATRLVEVELLERHQPEWFAKTNAAFLAQHPDVVEAMHELEQQGAIFEAPDNEHRGWARLACRQVLALSQIPHALPPTEFENFPPRSAPDMTRLDSDTLLFLLRQYDEASEWWIVSTKSQRLVLYCLDITSHQPVEIHNALWPSDA